MTKNILNVKKLDNLIEDIPSYKNDYFYGYMLYTFRYQVDWLPPKVSRSVNVLYDKGIAYNYTDPNFKSLS